MKGQWFKVHADLGLPAHVVQYHGQLGGEGRGEGKVQWVAFGEMLGKKVGTHAYLSTNMVLQWNPYIVDTLGTW